MNVMDVFYTISNGVWSIRSADDDAGESWLCLQDVCNVIRLKSIQKVRSKLPEEMQYVCRSLVYVKIAAICMLLRSTRKHVPPDFMQFIQFYYFIPLEIVIPCIETRYMRILSSAFAHLRPREQMHIGKYRCDLVLTSVNIILECDENGHSGYDKESEMERTRYLELKGYKFIRFNPNANGFNIGKVIQDIITSLS